MMPKIAPALGLLLLLLNGSGVHAWGRQGHQLVGALAEAQLTPEAKSMVAEILHGEPDPTLTGVATWADDMRNIDPERFRATVPWHYVNTPLGTCQYLPERDCPNGACVVAAIQAQRGILADRSLPLAMRRDALKFIVHFIGDVHQPLHASNRNDLGGNEFQVSLRTDIAPEAYARAQYKNGVMGTNLHAVWDYYILVSSGLDLDAHTQRLMAPSQPAPTNDTTGPETWAAESCQLIDTWALYPKRHKMDASYLARMRPHAEERIQKAAHRLATLLNEVLVLNKHDAQVR